MSVPAAPGALAPDLPPAGTSAHRPPWVHRDPPLVPAAVTATGPAARALAEALIAGPVARDAGLRTVASRDRLVVLGAPDDLPWCDGARYLGWDSGVLVPTGLRPTIPTDLLADQARRVLGRPGLVVLLPDALVGAPLPRRTADRAAVLAWLG